MERFRLAGEKVLRQQRLIRPFQDAVVEVSLPSLDSDSNHGRAFRVGPTGKLITNEPEKGPAGRSFAAPREREGAGKSLLHDGDGEDGEAVQAEEEAALQQEEDGYAGAALDGNGRRSATSRRRLLKSFTRGSIGHLPGPWGFATWALHNWVNSRLWKSRKKIKAGKDVLDTYNDSFLYGKLSLNTRVRTAIRCGYLGNLLNIIDLSATLLAIVLYVRFTYAFHTPAWMLLLQLIVTAYFLIDFTLKLYSAPIRIAYLLSLRGIVDIISTLPIIFLPVIASGNGGAPQIFIFFRIFRVLPLIRQQGFLNDAVSQQLVSLCVWVVGILFVAAGVFQWIETNTTSKSVQEENGCGRKGCYTYFDSFYFMVVTVSTVGYGEITANSNWGRAVVILVLILALTYIPAQINGILDLTSRRPYGGRFSAREGLGSRYVIIWGVPSLRTLQEFLSQFYHPLHTEEQAAFPLRVVIMAPFKPSFELKAMIDLYEGLVEYFEGHLMKTGDLDRIASRSASAFFLLADKQTTDLDAVDSLQFIHALAAHRHCGSDVPVVVEMLRPRNKNGAIWDDTTKVEVVCTDTLRFHLLARSCFVKGLTTFCTNLFRTGVMLAKGESLPGWISEYSSGQENEIYPMLLPTALQQLLFEEVVEFVFRCFGVLIFALDVAREGGRKVLLFPAGHVVLPTDVALVVARDLQTAQMVSKFKQTGRRGGGRETLLLAQVRAKWRGKESTSNAAKSKSATGGGRDSEGIKVARERESGRAEDGESGAGKAVNGSQNSGPALACLNSITGGGSTLEQVVEAVLTWPPPADLNTPPHPAALVKKEREILESLSERTLPAMQHSRPHILVAIPHEWPENMFSFVAALRGAGGSNPPIVILQAKEPNHHQWGSVGYFPEVYFVKGSPSYELDLMRAGIFRSLKVVILSPDALNDPPGVVRSESEDRPASHSPSSYSSDVKNIAVVATAERMLRGTTHAAGRVLCELQHEAAFAFVRPHYLLDRARLQMRIYERNRDSLFSFTPPYMEGKLFCSFALQFLLYKTFYNRNTGNILELLLGGPSAGLDEAAEGRRVQLQQIAAPAEFVEKTFGDMFVGLLCDRGALALGLYRKEGTLGAPTAYAFTNPSAESLVYEGDLVYILA